NQSVYKHKPSCFRLTTWVLYKSEFEKINRTQVSRPIIAATPKAYINISHHENDVPNTI
ncbi:MAG: hypothetical protein ACI83I_002765, partial [Bacteroidia bacterium]